MSASATAKLGLDKPNPGTGEPVDVAKLNASMDKIDAAMGGTTVTSTTRPATPFDNQHIRETDTRRFYVRNNTLGTWEQLLVSAGGLVEIDTTGKILLGVDTNLYRSAANTLKTDDAMVVTGALTSGAITAPSAVINGGAHKLMTQANDFQLASAYPLTATLTDLPGMSWTFTTLRANALAVVTWHGDFQTTGGTVGTGLLKINVDAVDVASPQAIFNAANTTAGGRATPGNQTHISLAAAGSHTIKLRAQQSGALGMTLNALHTTMDILIFE